MKILIVLSSCDRIPGSDRRTGTWYEELAAPFYLLKEAGVEVELASVAGGRAPIDPGSEDAMFQTEATRRFSADPEAQHALASTLKIGDVRIEDYDGLFFSGGLGPVFDLSGNRISIGLIEAAFRGGKPIVAVCHGVAALRLARNPQGDPLVQGRAVTGFSNSEEQAAHGVGLVPFLIEDELRRLGGHYSSAADWNPHVVADGHLITGQNPASSAGAAAKLLEALK